MIKVGVIGAFDNEHLISILLHHPDVTLKWVCEGTKEMKLTTCFPQLIGETQLCTVTEPDWDDVDVVFVCSPIVLNAEKMREMHTVPDLKIIDLTGDYLSLAEDAVLGLAELNRKHIVRGCQHVVCPDPVHHILMLSLLPLARNLMLTNDVYATLVGGSGLMIDFEQVSQCVAADLATLQSSFASQIHILPLTENFNRGLLATVSLDCNTPLDVVTSLYEQYYDDHNFTYLIGRHPNVGDVLDTNKCLINLSQLGKRLVITAVIDDEIKGAAGTAVHNMNLLFGLDERVGLTAW